ncbi:hypothetical protein SmJEL517_g00202 [Synchytrium microbalum]|uniref:Cilia- and flagella-associated protein 58 central coiled coil domain-containing protein n=1 Tax=Synchytrium microbalum TaxID=1806994 RepID=A0A507CFI6_9FUNG|nr:uncharacterized protein SmJEL517_g00202 [Synchytrium microbalum]TPX38261.1 hypothetical protein SmJEL517_g00202 [Synchytrium microbalum]
MADNETATDASSQNQDTFTTLGSTLNAPASASIMVLNSSSLNLRPPSVNIVDTSSNTITTTASKDNITTSTTTSTPHIAPIPLPPLEGLEEKDQQDTAFTAVEEQFREFLPTLQDDDSLAKFRTEYEKLHRALLRSRAHSLKLFGQYEELSREKNANMASTQEATRAVAQDQETARQLRVQIKKTEESVATIQKRDETVKEELKSLQNDVSMLAASIKKGVTLSVMQERTLAELAQVKETSARELEHEMETIVALRAQIATTTESIRTADGQKRALEQEIYSLRERNSQKKSDIDAETRTKDRLERDLRELRAVVSTKSSEIRNKQDAVLRATDDVAILEQQIKSQKVMAEKLVKDQETLAARTLKLKEECDEQVNITNILVQENEFTAKEVRAKEMEQSKNRGEMKRVNKLREALVKRNRYLETQKTHAEQERKSVRELHDTTVEQCEVVKKDTDASKKIIDDLVRERDILYTSLGKTVGEVLKTSALTASYHQTRHNIELEIQRYRRDLAFQQKTLKTLISERDSLIAEAAKLHEEASVCLQEIHTKEVETAEHKRKMGQANTKLKHQQNLYEAVQSERNLNSKQLLDLQAEIAELRRKLKLASFQINGRKEEINCKSEELSRESIESARLSKDVDAIQDEIKALKQQNEVAAAYMKTQIAEEAKLHHFVKEADVERARQENALQALQSEQGNLHARIVRLNDELAQVYDKLKLQRTTLSRGEGHYRERIHTLRELKSQLHKASRDKSLALAFSSGTQDLKKMTIKLEEALIREQTRIKALEEELANPVNVHRWRTLESTDPKAYEAIQLLQTLQRRLISKAKQDREKEDAIRECEETYLRLKSVLQKHTAVDWDERTEEYAKEVKDRNMRLVALDAEMDMYRARAREAQYEVARLDLQLDELKGQYLEARKQAAMLLNKGDTPPLPPLPAMNNISTSGAASAVAI